MIMGAVEILTFFPHMMQWPDALFRLLRSGWTSSDIATAQLYARGGLEKDDHMKRNQALRQQVCCTKGSGLLRMLAVFLPR